MRSVLCVAVVLCSLCPVFAGERPDRIYTNQDLEKYKSGGGRGSVAVKSFPHGGFSKCFELDSMEEAELKSFLHELDVMRDRFMAGSFSDEAKLGIAKSIKACREKVEAKLKAKKNRNSRGVLGYI
ncbi:MAG: hypothetical protein M1497_04495 [Nitrospirae bacterium]|nr:hypothetical protein [Nitrospirota bacterium]